MTTIEGAPLAQGLVRTDWHGTWVWAEDVQAERNVYAMFRRRFTADAAGELELRITADSFYTLYLDGKFIGHGPARSPLEYYSFDTYVCNVLQGEHCLAVLVHHVGE